MHASTARTPERALTYITDCNLATVSSMAMLKSRKKGEFDRQISIAQTACDWLRQMKIDISTTRVEVVEEEFGGCVRNWAESYMES